MAKKIIPNPEWPDAPYELVLVDNKTKEIIRKSFAFLRIGNRYKLVGGKLLNVPQFIVSEE